MGCGFLNYSYRLSPITSNKYERSLLADHRAVHCRRRAAQRAVLLPAVCRRRPAGADALLAAARRPPDQLAPLRADRRIPWRAHAGSVRGLQRWAAAAALALAVRERASGAAQPADDPRGGVTRRQRAPHPVLHDRRAAARLLPAWPAGGEYRRRARARRADAGQGRA